jgi:two-component system response regulator YesN
MSAGNYLVCGIRFRSDGLLDPERLSNWGELIRDILEGMIEIDGKFVVFRDYESHLMVLMNFRSRGEAAEFKGYEFTDLISIIRNQLNVETSIAISDFCESDLEIRAGFSRVLQTLRIKGPGQVWDCRKRGYSRATMGPESDGHALDVVTSVIRDLRELQEEKLDADIAAAWEAVGREGASMHLSYESLSSAILSILLTDIINAGISLKTLYGDAGNPEQMLAEAMDPEERKMLLLEFCHRRIEYGKEKKNESSDDVVGDVIRYMEKNFGNTGLSIADILGQVPVNQTYLRKMFKEETGKTLNEYLTGIRMEKAKELILDTQDKLADIAWQTGYSDVSYFSNCFKKYFGTSPKSLRMK